MPKFEKPSEYPIEKILEDIEADFWREHKLLDTKYHIQVSSYVDYDYEYGTSTIIDAKDLYGPYDTIEEAQADIKTINADASFKPRNGELQIRTARLVEKIEVKRFWI